MSEGNKENVDEATWNLKAEKIRFSLFAGAICASSLATVCFIVCFIFAGYLLNFEGWQAVVFWLGGLALTSSAGVAIVALLRKRDND